MVCSGCIKPKITLFPDATEPLREFTLQGAGREKILIVPVNGFISDSHRDLPFLRRSSMVQEIVSQLKKAEKDKDIKAVILKIDSPGGSVTASDMLYHEISKFKERSGVKLVVIMMGVAASGGYYVALPADFIFAHPTSITGSIGVVFLRPNVSGLMGKIGMEMEVDKSGKNKDMGSPFRRPTEEERRLFRTSLTTWPAGFSAWWSATADSTTKQEQTSRQHAYILLLKRCASGLWTRSAIWMMLSRRRPQLPESLRTPKS
jgi:protease-4